MVIQNEAHMLMIYLKRFFIFFLLLRVNNLYASDCSDYKKISIAHGVAQCEYINSLYSVNCPVGSSIWRLGTPYLTGGGNTVLPCYNYFGCGETNYLIGVIEIAGWTECPEEPITNNLNPPANLSINNQNSCTRAGSIIQTSNQVVGEIIPLTGAPFILSHFSSRAVARKSDYTSEFKTVNLTNSSHVTGYKVQIHDDAQNLLQENSFVGSSINDVHYFWNGLDINNVETWGSINRNFTFQTLTDDNSVKDLIYTLPMGGLKATKLGIGGWLPSIWHFYDSVAGKIYDGEGNLRFIKSVKEGIYNRVASTNGSEVYYFDSIGRIALTRTGITGTILYSFNYDQVNQKILNITDSFNHVTKFKYDSSGNISQIISPENIITNCTVDQNGYLKTVTNPKNEIYKMTYKDAGGLLSSLIKPNGVKSDFTYDENGNLLTDVNSGGQSSTLVKTDIGVNAVSTLGRITQNNYDATTNTEIEIRPSGLATTYVHALDAESVSNVINVTKSNIVNDPRFKDQVVNFSQVQTTNFGTSLSKIEDTVNLNDMTNLFSVETLTKKITNGSSELNSNYDGLTRTNIISTKLGRSISSQIDSYERPILEQSGNNLPRQYVYQNEMLSKVIQGDRETKFTYNPNTKLLSSVKNSENQEVNFYYDEAQRLSSKRLPDGRVINYQYDLNNNLVSMTPPGKPVHKLNYGATEQLSSYIPPSLQGVNNISTLYRYSKDKELLKITRPDGQEIHFNYDQTSGLLSSITGSFGVISREYQNELLTKIKDQNNQVAKLGYIGSVVSSLEISDANNNPVYQYHRSPSEFTAGKVGNETISEGTKSQNINYQYDDDQLLTNAGDLSLDYNTPNGQLVKTSLDKVIEYYTYNKIGEVKSYKAKVLVNGTEKLLYQYNLKRDRLGRIIKKIESYADEKQYNNGQKDHDRDDKTEVDYVYDKAGRLIQTRGFKDNSNYEYDSNSNRIQGHGNESEFSAIYDNQDRLIRFNNTIFSYNANGDMLSSSEQLKCTGKSKTPEYLKKSFNYDVFGNLTQTGKVIYQIDPLQRRSVRLVNGVVTNKYIYNPEGLLIGELDKFGNLIKTFIYASKSHVPDYFVDQNNERFKLIVDQLGSVRLVVKASSGEIIQKMNHDAFGKVLEDTKSMYQPFGFAGGLYDSETKLVRFGARDYNPEVGRWTSKDPIRFKGGDENLYGYVANDPINWIDDWGLIKKDPGESVSGPVPDFIVSPDGVAVSTQPGSRLIPASNGAGIIIQNPGSNHPIGNQIRIMDPTQTYPNGYIRVTDPFGRYLDPNGNIVPNKSPEGHWCK
jgi:RHS repeat-associated protein